jgi:hypothetical protein
VKNEKVDEKVDDMQENVSTKIKRSDTSTANA